MTTAQKIIKYLAIALAAIIIVSIASGIYYGGMAIIGVFEGDDSIGEMKEAELPSDKTPKSLSINIAAADLSIKTGDRLKVETNNSRISCELQGDSLSISEEKRGWLSVTSSKSAIIITVPEDLVFEKADIDSGAGRIRIESLSANALSLNLGAGEAVIDSLTVSGEADISGGAGRLEIKNAEIGHLDADHGVGELVITALVKNGGELDCGVGSVKVSLIGSEDDYSINVEKGLGEIKIDGKTASNDTTYGTGSSHIEINGGVGSVEVNFNK